MRQLLVRTLRRKVRREELRNGNVEPPLRTMFTDPGHVARWAWRTHGTHAPQVRALLEERGGQVTAAASRSGATPPGRSSP